MRLRRHVLTLTFGLLFLPLASLRASDKVVRFGYVEGDLDRVALAAQTGYVYCSTSDTLVLNPDSIEEAQKRLGAEILADGSWVTKDGKVLKPRTATYLIDDGKGASAGNGRLKPVAADKVVLAADVLIGDCVALLKGYKCQKDSNCNSACFGTTLWSSGPGQFSNCVPGAAGDSCAQTAGSVTCTYTNYAGPGCTGGVVSSGTQTFPNCQ
jgi:hypothetical protein